jgi:hypothetical protein
MAIRRRQVLRVGLTCLAILVLLTLVYDYQRTAFVRRANALFDSKGNAFKGWYLPWPIGRPSLVGALDLTTDQRIRTSLNYESGSIESNGLKLTIFQSDGTFVVDAQ